MKAATRALVFIVRVWHSSVPPSGFRAAVRPVDEEDAALFTDAKSIGDFFAARLDADGPTDGLGRPRTADPAGSARSPTRPSRSATRLAAAVPCPLAG